ncbi:hypothetical protein DFH06DRAFT_1131357 [Mycena polygramma]|nr:hypothetical protein DFH06DRAFT_1131343 [Mycena polygramma]KAJ7658368.1 hypothetical protein DFH06DRAFT_1131357 [Mycena polygramma]
MTQLRGSNPQPPDSPTKRAPGKIALWSGLPAYQSVPLAGDIDAPNRHGDIVWQTKAGRLDRGEHTPSEAREVRARKESKKKKPTTSSWRPPIDTATSSGKPKQADHSRDTTLSGAQGSGPTRPRQIPAAGVLLEGDPRETARAMRPEGLEGNRKEELEGRFAVEVEGAKGC